jgi:hypothetical protein
MQRALGIGVRAAETLREVFADNAEMLDLVTDEIVERFVHLIRDVGREARFVEFLIVLCSCNGRAVRPNQWRVCKLLMQDHPELLFRLHLRGGSNGSTPEVVIHGDPRYFPAFKDADELELSEWLGVTAPTNAAYFEHCLELLALLVKGRNLRNVAAVRAVLPYDLVQAAITSPKLNRSYLHVVTQFVEIAVDCYVDHEPHELMTHVKTVRIWGNVERVAESGKLSSRITTVLPIDWHQFDGLKAYLLGYIARFHHQVGTQVRENKMVLQLLQACYHLLRFGFYTSVEVAKIIPTLLAVLDGTADRVGLHSHEEPGERYKQRVRLHGDRAVNTVVIMECKLWCCKVLSLVCTMRVDIRLSRLLERYKEEFVRGDYSAKSEQRGLFGLFGGSGKATKDGRYARLHDEEDGAAPPARTESTLARGRAHSKGRQQGLFEVLSLEVDLSGDGNSDLVATLLDLTFYEHRPLVSAAFELVVRHFQQRTVLHKHGRAVQLLVKPDVIAKYAAFDELIHKLQRLAARRRLLSTSGTRRRT